MVFFDDSDASTSGLNEHDKFKERERIRELKMKKLATVAKSKFYMLKVSYPDIVEKVLTEMDYAEEQD